MSKYTRSFCGAFFGATLAIWPAATWNMAVLLLIGGVVGWLLGYHGDRVIGSSVRGYKYARRIGFKLFIQRMLLANTVARAIAKVWHGIGRFVRYVTPGVRFLFLTPIPFAKWGEVLFIIFMTVGSGIAVAPSAFVRWYAQHPINRASTLRFFAGVVGMAITAAFFWWLTERTHQPGEVMMKMNKQVILTEYKIFWDHFATTAILTAILSTVAMITLTRELETKEGYYGVWDRYERSGKVLFFVGEVVRFEYFTIWFGVTFAGGVIAGMISLLGWTLLVLPAYFGIVYAFRLAWRVVRLNRDYGIISLAVALPTGAITFFTLREELVADPVFRLSTSLVAGLVAGVVSMGITWFCGVMFGKSIIARRIALKEKYVTEGFDRIDPFENVLPVMWQYWKLLLPLRIREGYAAL